MKLRVDELIMHGGIVFQGTSHLLFGTKQDYIYSLLYHIFYHQMLLFGHYITLTTLLGYKE